MNTDNHLHDLIHELGRSLALPNLCFDQNNSCAIEVHGTMLILQWDTKAKQLCLTTAVGELSDGDFQELAVKLLQANYVWNDTRGASLALDAEAETILLCQWIAVAHMDYSTFRTCVEMFINLSANWKQTLPQILAPASPAATAPVPAETFMRV